MKRPVIAIPLFVLVALIQFATPAMADSDRNLREQAGPVGQLFTTGNFQAVVDYPDRGSDNRFQAYLYYMKGKACERLARQESAADYFQKVRTVERKLPPEERLLTLLSDITLFPWLVFRGESDQAAAVLSEILMLELDLTRLVGAFETLYGLTPPETDTVQTRLAEIKKPHLFSLQAGNRTLTGITVTGTAHKDSLVIIQEGGYFRILENRIFFNRKEAETAGNKRGIKPWYIKQYGPSLYMTQYGAYREFYGAWKRKRRITLQSSSLALEGKGRFESPGPRGD